MKDSSRAQYVAVTDKQSLEGLILLSRLEGIIPALETSHAIYYAAQYAKTAPPDENIVIGVSGRGDKDVQQVQGLLPKYNLKP